jgi:hypothetical protein
MPATGGDAVGAKRARPSNDDAELMRRQRSTTYTRAVESFGVRAHCKDADLLRFVEGFNQCQGQAVATALRSFLPRAPAVVEPPSTIVAADKVLPIQTVQITYTVHKRQITLDPFSEEPWVEPPPLPPSAVAVARLPPMAPVMLEVHSRSLSSVDLTRLWHVQLDLLKGGGASTLHRFDTLFACLVAMTQLVLCPLFRANDVAARASILEKERDETKDSTRRCLAGSQPAPRA